MASNIYTLTDYRDGVCLVTIVLECKEHYCPVGRGKGKLSVSLITTFFVLAPPFQYYIGVRYSSVREVYQWEDGTPFTQDISPWLPMYRNRTKPLGRNQYCPIMTVQVLRTPNEIGNYISSLHRRSCYERAHYICQRGRDVFETSEDFYAAVDKNVIKSNDIIQLQPYNNTKILTFITTYLC